MSNGEDNRYGRLTVIADAPPVVRSSNKRRTDPRHVVECDCGSISVVYRKHLKSGASRSCGCLNLDRLSERRGSKNPMTTHGMCGTPTYASWGAMLRRCLNPHAPNWADYGGRGIAVCERWLDFANFHADMGDRPADRSIDRIDNDGGYEPGNCRWATAKEQRANQRPGVRAVTPLGEFGRAA